MNFRYLTATISSLVFALAATANAQVLFTETFDDPSSAANFTITTDSVDDEENPSVYSEFGFDYSATGSSRLTQAIGAAPGGGSMSGLVLAANLTGGNRSSINLFPLIEGMGLPVDGDTGLPVIDGNYRMTFDFWGGVNGDDLNPGGGTSEYLQLGAQSNGDGTHINGFAEAAPDSDFFELNINGDLSGSDGIAFTTRGGVALLEPSFGDGGFLPHQSAELQAAFPRDTYLGGEDRYNNDDIDNQVVATGDPAAPDGLLDGGAPAEGWATAEISHVDGITSLKFNGVDIGTIEFSDFANDLGTDGLPWLGYADFFGSQAANDSTLVADGPNGGGLAADFNGDGGVDLLDLDILGANFGMPGAMADGDANGDGTVDLLDLDILGAEFGQTGGGGGSSFDPFNASFIIIDNVVVERVGASSAAVPEPTAALLALLAAAGFVGRRR